MRYAIISDVHANESALRLVLADIASQGVDQVISLGDVVGYGPLPDKALELVRSTAAVSLCGNHDAAVSGRQGTEAFIDLAADAIKRHRAALKSDDLAWLGNLPYTCTLEGALAAHGDFTEPPRFNYVDDETAAARNFEATAVPLVFVGHTHLPGFFLTGRSGAVYRMAPQDFVLEDGKRYIVNPGSVGYPRENDGKCFSSYVLYDSTVRTISFRFIPFDVSSLLQRGSTPRRRGMLLAVAVAAVAVGVSLVGIMFHRHAPEPVAVLAASLEDESLVLERKSLNLLRDWRFVRANLKMARKGDAVIVRVVFKSAAGDVTGDWTDTVAGSSAARIRIPAGSLSAHFTVRRQKTSDRATVLSFLPSGL